jgi:integrase/recombinase XerD
MKSAVRLPEMEAIRSPRKLPKLVTREEIEKILAFPDRKTAEGKRDLAVLELLYSSGLRASELTNIRPSDFLGNATTLRVKGKGGKERIVPVGKTAREAINVYQQDVYREWNPGFAVEALFLEAKGRPLSRQSLWRIVSETGVAVGISRKISPHMIRHSFASHLREAGMNLRYLQAILGHSDISTTQIYTHVEETRLREAHQKFHPRK